MILSKRSSLALGQCEQGGVAHQIGDTKLGKTRLTSSGHLAWASQLKIDFGQSKSVRRGDQRVNSLTRAIAQPRRRHQHADGRLRAAANASTKLMKLRQAETFRVRN